MSVTEIYQILVLQAGLDPEYVLDRMEQYEIAPIIEKLYMKDKESWEQSRMIAYVTAQTQSTKKLKPTDLFNFPWDNVQGNTEQISKEDIERLKDRVNKTKQALYGRSINKINTRQ